MLRPESLATESRVSRADADGAGGTDASPAPFAFRRLAITPPDGVGARGRDDLHPHRRAGLANGRREPAQRPRLGPEFIRRFLIHVLPSGFHRIRHYGLFASGARAQNIARVRQLLATAARARSDHAPGEFSLLSVGACSIYEPHKTFACGGRYKSRARPYNRPGVIDDYQGKGLGTALMRHIAAIARDAGLTREEPRTPRA